MFPSPEPDTNSIASVDPKPNKPSQRASAGLQIPSKNSRKNGTARDNGGGGVASVTKNAFKMANAKASAQATRVSSPERPSAVSSPPGNPITSPLLDALSSAALERSPSQSTNDWARNVPAYSSSPSNLINLGESPPVLQPEERLSHQMKEQRGIRNDNVSSPSPPRSRPRPLSYQPDGILPQSFDDHRSQVSYGPRRSSMYSQQSRFAQNPPLPHQAQAHFYSVPEVNYLLSPPTPGLIPGEKGYHCGFDSMGLSGNVVVAGYDGGVNIYSVSRRGLNRIAGIEGLRGGVCNAKILPWKAKDKVSHQDTLIALVIHGPSSATSDISNGVATPPSDSASVFQVGSARGSPRMHSQPGNENESLDSYQTTVELYSVITRQHIQTLLTVPKTHAAVHKSNPMFRAPLPMGSLTIRADSGHILVASGTTGETWIYGHADDFNTFSPKFTCIGKIWTTVQHGVTAEPLIPNGFVDSDWHTNNPAPVQKQFKASILSLNGRWLAFCPSAPSSQASLRAEVPGLDTRRVPGLNTHAPPQLPTVNCGVEMPEGESVMKQLVQIGTQKFIEAGNYLTQQGFSAWNNYRNKPLATQPTTTLPAYQNNQNNGHFPPTHGISAPAPLVTKDPGLVSILDLNMLAQFSSSTGSTPFALATFKIPHGCSFLSFAPNGLSLFTASSKGDVQFVWDMMRIQYAKSSYLKGSPQTSNHYGPHVRQIAQFSRMTVARIVDVVWASPHGERAAMVTEPGTVHVLDLPASAFTWPPPRRRTTNPKVEDSSNTGTTSLTPSVVAASAVKSFWIAAAPLVSRQRRSSVGLSARTVTAQAGHGTQALAAGISRSVGAATGKMNEMRKSVNAKLHLPRSSVVPSRACIMLLNGKRNDSVVVVGSGIVGIYTIKNRRADRPADKQKASNGAKYIEYRIPSLPDRFAQNLSNELHHIGDLDLTERDVEGSRWKARQVLVSSPNGTESSIPQAEIESNAPYQPFHTDRRVGLHTYCHDPLPLPSPSASALFSPPAGDSKKSATSTSSSTSKISWVFGGSIRSTKLDVGPPHNPDDDYDSSIERVMRKADGSDEMEQIVITTRRRRVPSHPGMDMEDPDEEGFFEDDCEVLDFADQRI